MTLHGHAADQRDNGDRHYRDRCDRVGTSP